MEYLRQRMTSCSLVEKRKSTVIICHFVKGKSICFLSTISVVNKLKLSPYWKPFIFQLFWELDQDSTPYFLYSYHLSWLLGKCLVIVWTAHLKSSILSLILNVHFILFKTNFNNLHFKYFLIIFSMYSWQHTLLWCKQVVARWRHTSETVPTLVFHGKGNWIPGVRI